MHPETSLLFVDDEADIRRLAARMLMAAGFNGDGAEVANRLFEHSISGANATMTKPTEFQDMPPNIHLTLNISSTPPMSTNVYYSNAQRLNNR